jgi:hypothetical protein
MSLTIRNSGTSTSGLRLSSTNVNVSGSFRVYMTPPSASGWEILLRYNGKKVTSPSWTPSLLRTNIGDPGTTLFRSASLTSTTASSRTTFGDSQGLYPAFFNKTGVTRIAFVDGTSNSTDPTTHTNYLIYNLVESTQTESIYNILDRLDRFQQSESRFDNQVSADNIVWTASSARFHSAGLNGYSGLLVASGGTAFRTNTTPAAVPTRFVIMGINLDSDNDIQALCAFTGTLAVGSGKGDLWRGENPSQTFWSYWGNDFHSNSQTQRIGSSLQTTPGVATGAAYTGSVYLLAF